MRVFVKLFIGKVLLKMKNDLNTTQISQHFLNQKIWLGSEILLVFKPFWTNAPEGKALFFLLGVFLITGACNVKVVIDNH